MVTSKSNSIRCEWLRKSIAAETPVPFTEDFKPAENGRTIVFEADSFKLWLESVIPGYMSLPKIGGSFSTEKNANVKIGDKFYLARRRMDLTEFIYPFPFASNTVEQRCRLSVHSGGKTSYCAFSATVYIPILHDGRSTWMSLTPNEVLTQRKLVRYAKGDVAVAGMGMGWLPLRVLQQPRVKSLTIVDIDKHILSYFGERLKRAAKEAGKKLRLVNDNAYNYNWMRHDQGLWDIWLSMNDGSDDARFWRICRQMRSAGKSCHGWYTVKPTDYCERKIRQMEAESKCQVQQEA